MKSNFLFFLVFNFLIFCAGEVQAQQSNLYSLDKKIDLPGDGGYDYLLIDQASRRLYVSHGTTVHVINLDTESLSGTIAGMQGNHGIAIVSNSNRGFVSDGKANAVLVFDLKNLSTIKTIPLSSQKPDAIIYDKFSNRVFAFNGASNNASIIDPVTLKETGVIPLSGAPEFAVSDGHGRIYNNIEDKNVMDVIDTKSIKVIKSYPLSPCGGPTGLAMDEANGRLFTACRENKGLSVLDIQSGKVITTIPIGNGVDAVAYDAGTKLIFCSNGDGTTTIIREQSPDSFAVVQTLATQNRAKTLALDSKTHKIYLSAPEFENGTRNIIPGTFKVLVYKMSGDK